MRPQMNTFRRSVPLPGPWHFQVDQDNAGVQEGWQCLDSPYTTWRQVVVPSAWNSYDPALWTYEGAGWYATLIPGSLFDPGSRCRLVFQRASFSAQVWLDGQFLGEHYGGDLPFEFDLGQAAQNPANRLLVVRLDNHTRIDQPPGSLVIERVIYGGLLKPVLLEMVPPAAIREIKIEALPAGGWAHMRCAVAVENTAQVDFNGSLVVHAPGGTAAQAAVRLAGGNSCWLELEIDAAGLAAWSPETPHLYTLTVLLLDSAQGQVDEVQERFGVRAIEVRGQQILLNGEPLQVRGVNRYDEFDHAGPAVERAALAADLHAIKASGANFIRSHYPQDPDLLDLLDEMGLMVMEEVFINWWGAPWLDETQMQEQLAPGVLAGGLVMLEGMLRRDWNHPSIIAWSMLNECGTQVPCGASLVRKLMARARELDKTRLVSYVAAGDARADPAFKEADFVGVNLYPGVFGGQIAYHIAEFCEKVTLPLSELLAAMAEAFADKPLIVTEFGCHGIHGLSGDARFSEEYQAAYLLAAWEAIHEARGVAGGVVWAWADYYHRRTFMGTGLNAEYGPFGVVTVDRRPKKALLALNEMYQHFRVD